MPSPREIAKQKNDAGKFDGSADSSYDGVAGTPVGVAPQGPAPDYAANPTNPADPSPPAKNLKR
jgi:hypothetical protein